MDALQAEIQFWELADHLSGSEGLNIVHVNEDGPIVWMEDDRKKPGSVIRLQLKSYDWSRQLRNDINRTYESAKTVRKRLKMRSANVINVILAPFTPVDSYEEDVSKPLPLTAGGKNQMRTILIPSSELEEKLFPLAVEWKLEHMPDFSGAGAADDHEMYVKQLKQRVKKRYETRQNEAKEVFFYGKPRLTFFLLASIAAVFLLMELEGSSMSTLTLIEFGAKFDPLILEGEWWRFFSAMFLHIGMLHLFMNSLALFYLGTAVERIFGTARFAWIYFAAGLAGSLSSFVFNDNISAGASGAIFGLFGALLYFGVRNKKLFFRTFGTSILVILVINIVFGFSVPMIDNGAHLGGLAGGFLAASAAGLPNRQGSWLRPAGLLTMAAAGSILVAVGFGQEVDGSQLQAVYYELGRESVEAEQFDQAEEYLTTALSFDPPENGPIPADVLLPNAYFLLAYAQIQEEQYEQAEENLEQATALRDDFHEAFYNLALLQYERGEYELALESIDRAIEVRNEEDYVELRDQITGSSEI
ncbi:rhomboid family intramembrane serine protease [Bacillus daqingensis]|uniref:Rhomboid family intramembrane serine protease n=1 Tax=Bacillus daqingensis TaxID=872396 RepID=A0ABV9NXQ3_9BACI